MLTLVPDTAPENTVAPASTSPAPAAPQLTLVPDQPPQAAAQLQLVPDQPKAENLPWWKRIIMPEAEYQKRKAEGTLPPTQNINWDIPHTGPEWRETAAQIVEAAPIAVAGVGAVAGQPELIPAALGTGAAGAAAHALAQQIRGQPITPQEEIASFGTWALMPGLPAGEIAVTPAFAIKQPVMAAAAKLAPRAVVGAGAGLSLSALYQLGTTGQIDWNSAIQNAGVMGAFGLLSGAIHAYDVYNAAQNSRQVLINYARQNWGDFKGETWDDLRAWANQKMTSEARPVAPVGPEAAGTNLQLVPTEPQALEVPSDWQVGKVTPVENLPSLPPAVIPPGSVITNEAQLPQPTLESGKAAAERAALKIEADLLKASADRAQMTQDLAHQQEMDALETSAARGKAAREAALEEQKMQESHEMFLIRHQGETLRQAQKVAQVAETPPAAPAEVAPTTPGEAAAQVIDEAKAPTPIANAMATLAKGVKEHPETLQPALASVGQVQAAPPAPATPPALTPATSPGTIAINRIKSMTPAQLMQTAAAAKAQGKSQTDVAIELAELIKGTPEVDQLAGLSKQAEADMHTDLKAGRLDDAMTHGFMVQFWHDTHMAATGTGVLGEKLTAQKAALAKAPEPKIAQAAQKALVEQAKTGEMVIPKITQPPTGEPTHAITIREKQQNDLREYRRINEELQREGLPRNVPSSERALGPAAGNRNRILKGGPIQVQGAPSPQIANPSGISHGRMTSTAAHLFIPVSGIPEVVTPPPPPAQPQPAAKYIPQVMVQKPSVLSHALEVQAALRRNVAEARLPAGVVPAAPAGGAGAPPSPPPSAPPAAGATPPPPRRPGAAQISLLNPVEPGVLPGRIAARGVQGPFNPQAYVRQQIARQQAAREVGVPTTALAKTQSFYYTLKRAFVDLLAPIEDFTYWAQKKGGFEILPTAYPGYHTDLADQFDRVLNSHTIAAAWVKRSVLPGIIQQVPDPNALGQYLIARHNETLAALGIEKGRNRAADQNLIASLYPTYEPFARKFVDLTRALLAKQVEYGLIPASLATELAEKYPDYAPTNVIFSINEASSIPGRGLGAIASLGAQSTIKRIEGSMRPVENPLLNLMHQINAVFMEGERNRAAEVLCSYRNLPYFKDVIRAVGPNELAPQHSISYLEAGEKRTFAVPEEFEQAAKQLGATRLNLLYQIMALPNRWTKLGITGLNPAFAFRNLTKDQMTALLNSQWGAATSILNPQVFLRAMYEAVGHGDIFDYMSGRGAMFTGFDPLRNPTMEGLAQIRAERALPPHMAYLATHPAEFLRAVEDLVGRTEQMTRIQQFIGTVGREITVNHRSPEDAFLIATKEARGNTANFPRHGEFSRATGLFQIFFNPRIQGTRADLRGMVRNPGRAGWRLPLGIFKLLGALMMPMALMTMWNMMDEKRRRAYLDISKTERENNFIWVPSNPQKDERNQWIVAKMPMPQGYNSLTWPIRQLVESHFGRDPVKASYVASSILNFISPLEMTPTGLAIAGLPQPIKPPMEVIFNKDSFTGAPIVPERLLKYSAPEQYDVITTSGSMVRLSRLLADASSGSIMIAPMQLEHLLKGWTGGGGADLLATADSIAKAMAPVVAPNQPVVWGVSNRGFMNSIINSFARAHGGQQLRDFYDNLKTASGAYNDWQKSIQEGDPTKASHLYLERATDISLAKTLSGYSQTISQTFQTIRMLQHQQLNETPVEKIESNKGIAALQEQILQFAELGNSIYTQTVKGQK